MKGYSYLAIVLACTLGMFSCKPKAILVNPGAVISKDGTDDGLQNIKKDFENAARTDDGIKFTISSDLLFPTNSSYLTEKAKAELDKLAAILKNDKVSNVRVEGHTDATGTVEYNQWLSEKRANSVKKYLADAGTTDSRIKAVGVGQTKPVAENKTPEGRQKNRRVEVVILNK